MVPYYVRILTNAIDGLLVESFHGELCVHIPACQAFTRMFQSIFRGFWAISTTTQVSFPKAMEVKKRRSRFNWNHVPMTPKDIIYLIWALHTLAYFVWHISVAKRRWRWEKYQITFGQCHKKSRRWNFPRRQILSSCGRTYHFEEDDKSYQKINEIFGRFRRFYLPRIESEEISATLNRVKPQIYCRKPDIYFTMKPLKNWFYAFDDDTFEINNIFLMKKQKFCKEKNLSELYVTRKKLKSFVKFLKTREC